ncbi:TPA: flagellin [Stenotrophomonas maltophilia]
MAQVINTNTMSLNAQRNLSTSGSSLATTIQRLSSGSRINSAKDDAAGLAISERFGTQIRGIDVAIRNANDGISLAQTAEGSLNEIGNNLQRIRELSVQSSNATNSTSDRKALQAEVTQLVSEIDRVAKQSDFNGTKLLDGSFSSQLFQVGANAGQGIAIDKIVNAQADSLGAATFAAALTGAPLSGTATPPTDKPAKDTTYQGLQIKIAAAGVAIADAKAIDIGDISVKAGESIASATVSAINGKIGETGVYAEVGKDGAITLSSVKAGQQFALDMAGAKGTAPEGFDKVAATAALLGLDDASAKGGLIDPTTAKASTLKDLSITTSAGAQQALDVVDKALESINSTRADLGAIQNRFTSVVANLQTSTENLSASRSRIKDTDFAKETAELTRTQILQQAGTAMLAQANQVPQGVLSLLR